MTKPLPYALVLRKVKRSMRSRGGFKYPTSGRVSINDKHDYADKWDPRPRCGGGLHGYKWGQGVARRSMPEDIREDSHGKWLVIKALDKDVVEIKSDGYPYGGIVTKCKFKCGVVVFCGTRKAAAEFIAKDPNFPKGDSAKEIFYRFSGC